MSQRKEKKPRICGRCLVEILATAKEIKVHAKACKGAQS